MEKRITFLAALPGKNGEWERVEIDGEEVDFGLVLHPRICGEIGDYRPTPTFGYTISEPTTGCRVVHGYSRDDTLAALSVRVDAYGGPEPFKAAIARSVELVQGGQRAAFIPYVTRH